jgi:hypothetical protein
MYFVKDTPILKNKKLFKVGEVFPYSENDKHLLWNLTKVEEADYEIVPDTAKDEIAKEKASESKDKVTEITIKRASPNSSAKSSKAEAKTKKKTISKNIKR